MKRIFILVLFALFIFASSAKAVVFTDPAVLAAIVHQTSTQTAQHLQELAQAIQQVQLLQSELTSAQNLLQLAQQSAQGLDGLQALGSFQNAILQANAVITAANSYFNIKVNLPQQWQSTFGSLNPWITNTKDLYGNINVSDSVNTSGYLIADSYQQLYRQNAAIVSQYLANASQVSEKGALKQIAASTAQLIQMENNVIYLLSQLLKGQAIEAANENLNRKNEAIRYEQENQGVINFMNTVSEKTFAI